MKSYFYITTPIFYPTGIPSLQSAYATVTADCCARYKRLMGSKVYFVTGSDEHGQKVQRAAKSHRMTPQAFVDRVVGDFKTVWKKLQISYDEFVRTSSENHIAVVEKVFNRLVESDDIYLGEYSGWYCISCESFWLSSLVEDNCCPNPECHGSVEEIREKSYFFRLSKYAHKIMEHVEKNPGFIEPGAQREEIIQVLRKGLQDLCVTRKGVIWGIPVPPDPDFTIYVWVDALISYISAAGFGGEKFNQIWPANIHVIRKGILVFHSIILPAFCIALGIPLPETIFAHGYFNESDREKMQHRPGIANLVEIVDEFGPDAIRYYFLRETSFGQDMEFSYSNLLRRMNSDLANNLGNLFRRSVTMIGKYAQNSIPPAGQKTSLERNLARIFREVKREYKKSMDRMNFRQSLKALWDLVDELNRYIEATSPWNLHRRKETDRLNTILYTLADYMRILAILLSPFMPKASMEMWKQLGFTESIWKQKFDSTNTDLFPVNQQVRISKYIFPRYEPAEVSG